MSKKITKIEFVSSVELNGKTTRYDAAAKQCEGWDATATNTLIRLTHKKKGTVEVPRTFAIVYYAPEASGE